MGSPGGIQPRVAAAAVLYQDRYNARDFLSMKRFCEVGLKLCGGNKLKCFGMVVLAAILFRRLFRSWAA